QVAVRLGAERPEAAFDLSRALTDPTPMGRMDWPLRSAPVARRAEAGPGGEDTAPRDVTGPMFPANLVMTSHLLGTPWALPLAEATWWIEEVGERPYELDRYLTHLHLAGALRALRGVLIGDLTYCMDPLPKPGAIDDPTSAVATVLERLQSFGVPALLVDRGPQADGVVDHLHRSFLSPGSPRRAPLPSVRRCRGDRRFGQ
ncbi:MAG TPA: hypothetical protein PKU97_05910, partial [Kofleriaceae bacterium]|nr:hypothetical protein [Kofleriaceae bacterium]